MQEEHGANCVSPVYIKALYEYFKDKLDTDFAPTDDLPSPIALADFQQDGYAAAKDILETYGGVLIADSVGLGKTYLGCKLLEDYAYHLRQKALVICPAQLREMWRRRLDAYRIYAVFRSQEEVSRSDFHMSELADCDLLLIDESHNFRNPTTNRFENLSKLLQTARQRKSDGLVKLILVTATPINNSVFDLYHQLHLVTGDRDDFFARAGVASLTGRFRYAKANPDVLWELLEEVSVRRSRPFIRQNYPNAKIDGKLVHFPDRELHTIHYGLEASYEGLYEEVVRVIENLNLAPYHLDFYRKALRPEQPALWETLMDTLQRTGMSQQEAQQLAFKLGRQAALVELLKMLYLKRLESSAEALRISLDRQQRFQARFLKLLQQGKLLDAANFRRIESIINRLAGEDTDQEEAEEEADREINQIIAKLSPIDPAAYDVPALQAAVSADVAALKDACEKLSKLTAAQDDKLEKLKDLLTGELKGKKVVVFSYFKDTARYLYRELRQPDFLAALGHEDGQGRLPLLTIVDGGVDSHDRQERIARFAPITSEREELKGTEQELHLLISTDVLSEGQNLQDADTVINYDLHWNPVQMVQRAGRIDRIGSLYEVVHIYNFNPEDRLESLIHLTQRLRDKLDAINKSGFLDAPVFEGQIPTPRDYNFLHRIAAEDKDVLDELEAMSDLDIGEFLKQDLLDFIESVSRERLERIPYGVGSGKRGDGKRGVFVALKEERSRRHFWCFYDLETRQIIERKLEAIRFARCKPDEKRIEPDFDVCNAIGKVKRHLVNRLKQLVHRLPKLSAPQNYIVNWLQAQPESTQRDTLLSYFSEPLHGLALKELKRLWQQQRKNRQPATLMAALDGFARQHPHTPDTAPKREEVSEEDLQLVCWMALV